MYSPTKIYSLKTPKSILQDCSKAKEQGWPSIALVGLQQRGSLLFSGPYTISLHSYAEAFEPLRSRDGHLISYGGMSKEPLKIPVGLQIFKNLTCHGYWHSRRWPVLSPEEQEMRMNRLIGWKEEGKVRLLFFCVLLSFYSLFIYFASGGIRADNLVVERRVASDCHAQGIR